MKIAIDIGHNAPPDTGAYGIKSEDALNLALGKSLEKKLAARGHEVIIVNPQIRVSTVAQSVKIYIPINITFRDLISVLAVKIQFLLS
jgi:N-acetylmuramoyl-L-alanine amidase